MQPLKATFTYALLILVVPLASAVDVHAQNATISGFITDASDGQPLGGANVVLRDEGGIVRGAAASLDGTYLIARIDPGRYELQISFIGYETYVDTLTLAPNEVRTINVALAPDEAALGEVVVEAEGTAGAARITAGHQKIRPEALERVPTPTVTGDLASYLTTQPGVVSLGDRGGQLYIRGGEPTQNRIFIDGIPVYQPFHVLGFFSAFPAGIISNVDIYAGGFGSQFGGALSSIIDVSTRTGNKKSIAGAVSASPFIGTVRLEGPLIQDRVSLLVSARKSMLNRGASRYIDQPLPFSFGDVFGKLHGRITSASRLWVTGLYTYDRGTIGRGTGGKPPEQVRWQNRALGLHYLILPDWLPVKADMYASYSSLNSELGPPSAPIRTSSLESTRFAIDATFPGQTYEVRAGWIIEFLQVDTRLGGLYQNIDVQRPPTINHIAYYIAPEFRIGDGLRIRPGLRLQFYHVRFDPFLEPRLRMSWDLGIHQVSAAGGMYQQEIIGLHDRRDAASVFTAWTNIPKPEERDETEDVRAGRLTRAWHGILGYRVHPTSWFELSIEGYYKKLSNLFIAEWTSLPQLTTRLQPATGRSFGADLRLELSPGPFYGYINYGYSNTIYHAQQAEIELWYGTESMRFRPPHDRRHQVNVLASTSLYGFDLSVRWTFGSGRPFSRAIGFDGFVLVDDIINVAEVPGRRRVIYERPFNGLLPTYHRLDIALERTFSFDAVELTAQASVINVYDRDNIFYLDVFTLQRANQLPMVPSLGLKIAFE